MNYCRNMEFEEEPDYNYIFSLINRMAIREKIDLYDNIYDWSVKAVTIEKYPHFFDFMTCPDMNPLDRHGRFKH